MEVFEFDGEWWIIGPDLEVECGGYATKAEAESDMEGMRRFLRDCDKPGYCMSIDEERKQSLE